MTFSNRIAFRSELKLTGIMSSDYTKVIQFLVGIILGVVLTVSLLEHSSFQNLFGAISTSKPVLSSTDHIIQNLTSLKKSVKEDEGNILSEAVDKVSQKNSIFDVVTTNIEDILSGKTTSSADNNAASQSITVPASVITEEKKDITELVANMPKKIKWAPGNADMTKYREAAEQAQQTMIGNIADKATANSPSTSTPEKSITTRTNPKKDTENMKTESAKISDTGTDIPNKSDLKAQQKQLKKLKKMEKLLQQAIEGLQEQNTSTLLFRSHPSGSVGEHLSSSESRESALSQSSQSLSLSKFNTTSSSSSSASSLPELQQKLQEIQDRQKTLAALTQHSATTSTSTSTTTSATTSTTTVEAGKTSKTLPATPKQSKEWSIDQEGTLFIPKDHTLADYHGRSTTLTSGWQSVQHPNGIRTFYRPSYRDLFPQRITLYDQFRTFHRVYGALYTQDLASHRTNLQQKHQTQTQTQKLQQKQQQKHMSTGGKHVSYHDQALVIPDNTSATAHPVLLLPAIRSYDQAVTAAAAAGAGSNNSNNKLLPPNMVQQRGVFEKENVHLHLCNGVFEAYSASYLTTTQHMIAVESESFNLSWVNCEMASFIHMKESKKFYSSGAFHGVIMQSLDVLDYSVIHLSAFERSSKKYNKMLWANREDQETLWKRIDAVIDTKKQLEALNNPFYDFISHPDYARHFTGSNMTLLDKTTIQRMLQQVLEKKQNQEKKGKGKGKASYLPVNRKFLSYLPEAWETVVIMPFLGGAMGAGHSELNNRYEYLKTCFWSLFEFFPNIVISVTTMDDLLWGMQASGLPFYDIILIDNLPKSAGLPVGTTQQTKFRLIKNIWTFKYLFFTESDQILISRQLALLYEHLKQYPGHMLLPHRLMPYSSLAMSIAHQRELQSMPYNAWMGQSCCLPRQNCMERKSWKALRPGKNTGKAQESMSAVPVINYYGLYVPLGNVNFLREEYRACTLTSSTLEYCP